MANTSFAYVRNFEQADIIPPSNFIVVRIDGRGFSKFSARCAFEKPNDIRALHLMNAAAAEVVRSFVDIVIAYGQSDEYSFVFAEETDLWERRSAKLATSVATQFTAEYCMQWKTYFPDQELGRPFPTFDGRCVAYPKRKILRDYLSWRQADCHINNLYNTTFWNMVLQGNMTNTAAELELKGTLASDKNEILFQCFQINYNNEPAMFRKGTVIYRDYSDRHSPTLNGSATVEENGQTEDESEHHDTKKPGKKADPRSKSQREKERKRKLKATICLEHVDLVGEDFWRQRPWILAADARTAAPGVVENEGAE